jgi:glycolate oxidase FAD binding subunit
LTGVECGPFVLEGRAPDAAVFPASIEEISALLALAAEEGLPVTPWGGGTKMAIGSPPTRVGLVLGLRRMNRLLEHEPGDLTATVQAGMTISALQTEFGRRGQWLSLDPPYRDQATVGGILAANASGPRRHLYGTARDLLIGVTVVSADGSVVRGGGKVVKNVAGYDLPKLYIGSFGSLGIIVEATVKLRPRPDVDRLVVARFDRMKACGQAVRALMSSDLIPSALELVDGEALAALGLGGPAGGAVLVGFDGIAEQVEWQCAELERILGGLGLTDSRILDGAARDGVWRGVGELGRHAFEEPAAAMKWGVLPTQVVDLVEQGAAAAHRNGLRCAFTAHAAVGIVTALLSGGRDAAREVVATLAEWRRLANDSGGHALLEWAPLGVKEQVAVWDSPGPSFRIMERLKAHLDPKGIMNPGRFVGGI